MSWSFSAIGKPAAVAKAAQAAKETNVCAQPEETYRQECLESVARMAGQIVGDLVVMVSASGSMWKDRETVRSHSMQLKFEPLYGFVE